MLSAACNTIEEKRLRYIIIKLKVKKAYYLGTCPDLAYLPLILLSTFKTFHHPSCHFLFPHNVSKKIYLCYADQKHSALYCARIQYSIYNVEYDLDLDICSFLRSS